MPEHASQSNQDPLGIENLNLNSAFVSNNCNDRINFFVLSNDELIFKTYLDRQGRNEYINLASQIGYSGSNIAFIFSENQIRELMSETSWMNGSLKL